MAFLVKKKPPVWWPKYLCIFLAFTLNKEDPNCIESQSSDNKVNIMDYE
jgi:hypothetical protein